METLTLIDIACRDRTGAPCVGSIYNYYNFIEHHTQLFVNMIWMWFVSYRMTKKLFIQFFCLPFFFQLQLQLALNLWWLILMWLLWLLWVPSISHRPFLSFISAYISSIIGFHRRTRAFINQLDTWSYIKIQIRK